MAPEIDPQTEAEWKAYFKARKKFDFPMSEEEQLAIATKILELTPKDPEFHVLA